MPIQLLLTVVALFAFGKALVAYRAHTLDKRKLLYWTGFWAVVVAVVWLPQTTSVVAAYLGVGRGVDAALYVSILVLFYALFQTTRKVERLERALTDLVRALALKDGHRND